MINTRRLIEDALNLTFRKQLTSGDLDLYASLTEWLGVVPQSREKLGIMKLIAIAATEVRKQPFSQVGGILNVLETADPLAILDLMRDPQNALNGAAKNAVSQSVKPYVQAIAVLLYLLETITIEAPNLNTTIVSDAVTASPVIDPSGKLSATAQNTVSYASKGHTTLFRQMNNTAPADSHLTIGATTGNKVLRLQADGAVVGPGFQYSINGGAAVNIPVSPGVFVSTDGQVVITSLANGNLNSVSGSVTYSRPLYKFWDLVGSTSGENIDDIRKLLENNPIFESIYQNLRSFSVDDQNTAMTSIKNVIGGLTAMAIPADSAAALSICFIHPELLFTTQMVHYAGSIPNLQTISKLIVLYHLITNIVPDTLELITDAPSSSSARLY
jgi:hypothetical protein